MKPTEVTSDSYAEYSEDSNKKEPKFKVGDHVRISKYKKSFTKECTPNWSKEVFFSKIKNTVSWTYVISGLNGEPIVGGFYEKKNCKNLDQQEFRIGKATKRKDDKLHVKWKGYDNSFNSWIQKKDLL